MIPDFRNHTLSRIFLLFHRHFFHPDLHPLPAERHMFLLQLLPRLVSDLVGDGPGHEPDHRQHGDRYQEEDEGDDRIGHDVRGKRSI